MAGSDLRARASLAAHRLLDEHAGSFVRGDDGSVPMVVVLGSDTVARAARSMSAFGDRANVIVYVDDQLTLLHAGPPGTPSGDTEGSIPLTVETTFADLLSVLADGLVMSIRIDDDGHGPQAEVKKVPQLA